MRECAGPDRQTRRPKFVMPRGACDCHVHVFGPQALYPFSEKRSYTPEDCTVEDLEKLHATLGVDRAVIVHGGAHGTDNRVTLAALDRNPDALRGVAVIPSGLPRRELEDMHRRGMRGCRMSTVVSGGASFAHLRGLADETFDLGWHLVLHFNRATELVEVAPLLKQVRSPFVLDHLARIESRDGVESPAFTTLMRLLDTDRCWIKFASLYRLSAEPYPHRDMLPMISRVVEKPARPDPVGQQLATSDLSGADAQRWRPGRFDSALVAGRDRAAFGAGRQSGKALRIRIAGPEMTARAMTA
jgi:2-pyrone-4,6-dicarboxylate lactonase